jgi:NitT/TauT family transport system substrate-binding protein
MKRRHILSAVSSGALALAAPGLARAQQATKVRFGVDQFVLGAQIWVAREKGYFERNGIDAEITPFAFGVDTIDAVLTERLDFGVGLDFATLPRLQTGQLKIVSAIIEPLPGFHRMAVRAPISRPADLAGKRLGLARGTAQHLVTIKYVENAARLPISAVTLVPLASLLEIIAALRADRIDAAFVWADGVNQATAIPNVSIIGDDSPANMRQFGYLATRRRLAEPQPQVVDAVLKALAETTDWIVGNMAEASQIVATRSRAPLENVQRLMPTQNFTLSLKPEHLAALRAIAAFAAENGITRTLIDPATAVDASFLRRVAPNRVTLTS